MKLLKNILTFAAIIISIVSCIKENDPVQADFSSGQFQSISQLVNGIISSFTASSGLPGFTAANYGSFFSYKLNAGDDRVCALNPQPLVMIRKVTLIHVITPV